MIVTGAEEKVMWQPTVGRPKEKEKKAKQEKEKEEKDGKEKDGIKEGTGKARKEDGGKDSVKGKAKIIGEKVVKEKGYRKSIGVDKHGREINGDRMSNGRAYP